MNILPQSLQARIKPPPHGATVKKKKKKKEKESESTERSGNIWT